MPGSPPDNLNRRVPVVTFLTVGAALVLAAFPRWSGGLLYDRQAILAGEVWRLSTGHWVHFSTSHLVYDSLAMGLTGWMLETRQPRAFVWLMLLAPPAINTLLLVFCPDLLYAGGLSGLGTCALVFLALEGLRERSGWRVMCWLALGGVAAKLIYEGETGRMLFATVGARNVEVCTASHMAGSVTALAFWGVMCLPFRLLIRFVVRPACEKNHPLVHVGTVASNVRVSATTRS